MGKVTNNKRTASIQKTEGKGGTKMSGTLFGDSSFKCVNAFRIALRKNRSDPFNKNTAKTVLAGYSIIILRYKSLFNLIRRKYREKPLHNSKQII